MSEVTHGPLPPPPEPSDVVPLPPSRKSKAEPEPILGSILLWPNWNRLTAKIAKVHAVYSIIATFVIMAVSTVFMVFVTGTAGAGFMVGVSLAMLIIVPLIAYVMGLISGYLTMWILYWPLKGTLRVMDWSPNDKPLALTSGALIALVWALPWPHDFSQLPLWNVVFVFINIALNTLVGQAGAVLALADRFREGQGEESDAGGSIRFNLYGMLAVMIPICVVLSLLQFFKLLRIETLAIAGAWLVIQYFSRKPAIWLTLWWLRRQEARRGRGQAPNTADVKQGEDPTGLPPDQPESPSTQP